MLYVILWFDLFKLKWTQKFLPLPNKSLSLNWRKLGYQKFTSAKTSAIAIVKLFISDIRNEIFFLSAGGIRLLDYNIWTWQEMYLNWVLDILKRCIMWSVRISLPHQWMTHYLVESFLIAGNVFE